MKFSSPCRFSCSWAPCWNARGWPKTLLENMSRLFAGVRGWLGISVSIVGALLAASTGIVGATVVTMSLLSLPTMLRRGYAPSLAAGSIAAAGTLGQIIPPSIVLVLLGDVIANAYQKAQLEQGIFAPETVSVGELFSGSLIPGLVLVGLYIIYQVGLAIFKPSMAPPAEYDDDLVLSDLLGALFAPSFSLFPCWAQYSRALLHQPRRLPLVPWAQFCWPDTSSATDKNLWPPVPFPSFSLWCLPTHSTCGWSATPLARRIFWQSVSLWLCAVSLYWLWAQAC